MWLLLLLILVCVLAWCLRQYFRSKTFTGAAEMSMVEFISTAPLAQIRNELGQRIYKDTACDQVLGRGNFSTVFELSLGKDVAIKIAKNNDAPIIFDGKDELIIMGYGNLTTEALILMLLADRFPDHKNLPQLIDYGCCGTNSISRLALKKYGLGRSVKIQYDSIPESLFWNGNPRPVFVTSLITLADLFAFYYYTGARGEVVLPNGHNCNIVEYFDSVCEMYLSMHDKLTQAGFYPFDMHPDNIFLDWSGGSGAPVPVLGDVGSWMAQPRKDLIIVGTAGDRVTPEDVHLRLDPNYTAADFIYRSVGLLSPELMPRTKTTAIFEVEPYKSYPVRDYFMGDPEISRTKKMLPASKLLELMRAR